MKEVWLVTSLDEMREGKNKVQMFPPEHRQSLKLFINGVIIK